MEIITENFANKSEIESDRRWLDQHRQSRRIRRALKDEAPYSHMLIVRSAGMISKFPVYQTGGEA
jgi:hypothetical protein